MRVAIKPSKSQEIQSHFRRAILGGQWQSGDRLPTESEIRQQFGVGNSTVREAILALVSDGLVERRQGSGTYVRQLAESAGVGIVANLDMLSEAVCVYYRHLLKEIQSQVRRDGFRGVLCVGDGSDPQSFAESTHLMDRAVSKQTVGVLSVVSLGEMGESLKQMGIPQVSIVHHKPMVGSAVVLDYRELVRIGVGEFFDAGIEKIAIFIGEGDDELQNRRARGRILRWFRECGLDVPEDWFVGVPQSKPEQAYDRFVELWNGERRPEGVFFLDDVVCNATLRAVTDLGISVPSDLAIVTESNVGRQFMFPVELTQIQFDPSALAKAGWDLLHKLIREQSSEDIIQTIPPVLIKGQSLM